MKNNYIITLFSFLSLLFFSVESFSQDQLVKEIPMEEHINSSDQIVEGKVVEKSTYWDAQHSMIYTLNKIEVYKVFKGENTKTLYIATPGGMVGNEGILITPSLKMYENEIGVFYTRKNNLKLDGADNVALYVPNGSIQGMTRYNILEDAYVNPFFSKKGISENLYPEIEEVVGQNFRQLDNFDVDRSSQDYQRMASPDAIISITPLTSSAGTNSILTITGTGFGNTRGDVLFPNADTGGERIDLTDGGFIPAYLEAYDSHFISWTDTEIRVEIPSYAGTGRVRVETSGGTIYESDILTLSYAHINVITTTTNPVEYQTQFYDKNGDGGYDWFYNINFNNNEPAKAAFERAFFNWVCSTGVNWSLAGVTALSPNVQGEDGDDRNVIGFRDDFTGDDANVIGYAISRFAGCNDGLGGLDVIVEETDMVFNSDFTYNYGPEGPLGSEIDFETVAVHELGHAHQLGHIIDPGAIMHFNVAPRTMNRIPDENDITGAVAVFNRSANDPICGLDPMTASSCSLSVDDMAQLGFTVFPNPARQTLNILTPSDVRVDSLKLVDTQGRTVRLINEIQGSHNSINVENLSTGMYILQANTSQGQVSKRIIIQ